MERAGQFETPAYTARCPVSQFQDSNTGHHIFFHPKSVCGGQHKFWFKWVGIRVSLYPNSPLHSPFA